MPRLNHLLIAAVLAVGLAAGVGAPLAQSQTETPAAQTAPAAKGKKALTPEEKAQRKEERAAKRKNMTPEEKAKLKQDRAAKKAAKGKRQECRDKGKQDNLKGKKLREFVQTCAGA